ncbi:16S rRNA (cytidine1402-2'-O)-methyltransferase [Rhodopseudomonas julia]|uniref:Ribosomal RNA small subunit methyltransferase I n=1 Tax=Rhodopseudomonas julia TaxID=200617 RepID=A0ABU0C611_9BRAD|nr:16S rRNA (cytidine(1402)-2'-O)-methyltransferase [Rhodopseudomonas julia]MDQ0325389.1 16S rRNA (cytidine1402-2'-O)-methyltransferase [Rhodopseudomonas julia]
MRGHEMTAPHLEPGLYVTATPIGHLGDITIRALEVLAAADVIAAEDTRVTRKLLSRYGITTRLTAYHEHSHPDVDERLVKLMAEGEAVALVTDAGTPVVSDPGTRLVSRAAGEGIAVHPIPGASSLTAALSVAGISAEATLFLGFLPAKEKARRDTLQGFVDLPFALVLLEAPHRLQAFARDAAEILGDRPVCLCREMTKLHETFLRGSLADLADAAGGQDKGEIVVIVGPPAPKEAGAGFDEADLDRMLAERLGTMGVKDAAREVAEETGLPRRVLYQRALSLGKE